MVSRYPKGSRFHRRKPLQVIGEPKFSVGDRVGDFEVIHYMGHSDVNKRNNHIMAKPQHWYRCLCSCGTEESRSQQELVDTRRSQCCFNCRSHNELEESPNENQSGRS